mgnify:CR=1 FL=1
MPYSPLGRGFLTGAMTREAWVLFAAMSVIWGIPYLFIKVAGEEASFSAHGRQSGQLNLDPLRTFPAPTTAVPVDPQTGHPIEKLKAHPAVSISRSASSGSSVSHLPPPVSLRW